MQISLNRQTVLWTALLATAFALQIYVFNLWLHTPPTKAKQLKLLIVEMDNYRKTHGRFPASCVDFDAFTNISKSFSIYTGELDTNGVSWSPFEVSKHDFTVLTDKTGYEIFLPKGQIKFISFSSFSVWCLDSNKHRWQKGRIHWSMLGSYWDEN
jgi:hypothetical protein